MNPVQLQDWQVWTLGIAASVAAQILTWTAEKVIPWLAQKLGKAGVKVDAGRVVKTIVVGIVAGIFAFWWFPFAVPALPELYGSIAWQIHLLWGWTGDLLTAITPYVGAATLVFNTIGSYLVDGERRKEAFQKLLDWLLNQAKQRPGTVPAAK